MFRFLVVPAAIILFIWALVDCIKVPDDSMYQNGNKLIWVLVIILLPFFLGPLIYLLIGKPLPSRYNR